MFDFSWFSQPDAWAALLTLTLLEVILGIDNIIFISILVDRLPEEQRAKARFLGLGLAMVARLVLLASITWIMSLKTALFHVSVHPALWNLMPSAAENGGQLGISLKDIILLAGGLFLLFKSTREIHHKLEADEEASHLQPKAVATMTSILVQIAVIDMVFSIDSVITAVGMADRLSVMALAVIIAIGVMMLSARLVSDFVSKHPSVKVLALSFLILIGVTLIAEGLHFHIPKGYVYFAMFFSLGVESINLKLGRKSLPAVS